MPESETIKGDVIPAVGFSITADLGAGLQLVMQTHVSRPEAMNGALDKLMDRFYLAAMRQRAKGEVEVMERHIDQNQKQIADGDARVAQAQEQYEKQKAELNAGIENAIKEQSALTERGRADWAAKQRRGEFTPSASVMSNLTAKDAVIKGAKESLAKLDEQRDKALAAEGHAKQVALDEIAKTNVEIERRKKLISPSE